MKMKKTILLTFAVLMCLLMLTACSSTGSTGASRDFTTLHEQSELRWYISEKYGKEAVSKYCYFDLSDHGETDFVIAQRYQEGEEPDLLFLVFDMGLFDWFEYGNTLCVSGSSELYREIPDVGTVYRLKMVPAVNPEAQENYADFSSLDLFVTYNKDRLLERIYFPYTPTMETGVAGIYAYDKNGFVSVYGGTDWTAGFEYVFSSDFEKNHEYQMTYTYGKDGLLKEAFEYDVYGDYPCDRYTFSSNTFGRTSILLTDPETGETDETLETKRDADGRLVSVRTYSEGRDYERNYAFFYKPGGFCVVQAE